MNLLVFGLSASEWDLKSLLSVCLINEINHLAFIFSGKKKKINGRKKKTIWYLLIGLSFSWHDIQWDKKNTKIIFTHIFF